MRRLSLVLLALAAACAAPPPPRGLRDPTVTIASAALFDPARFAGTWHVTAGFDAEPGCTGAEWRFAPLGPGRFGVTGARCAAGRMAPFAAEATLAGPGRLAMTGGGFRDPIWVLWVDEGYRAAAIGTPSGAFGYVLSRTPQARGDLAAAAAEVLDFNGYDLGALRRY